MKTIAGISIITNSIPPNNLFERLNDKINEIQTEMKFIKTSLIFPNKNIKLNYIKYYLK